MTESIPHEPQSTPLRVAIVMLLVVLILAYTTAVIVGAIPQGRQLDVAHLALLVCTFIACAIILRPQALDRLTRLEGLGFKIELLQRLQERQAEQAEELYRLDLIVPLLFRDGEREHLRNLLRGTTKNYSGGSAVRDELRRLRAIGLLKSFPDRHVGDLHGDTKFDLAQWVELTNFGRYWAERLERLGPAALEPPLPGAKANAAGK